MDHLKHLLDLQEQYRMKANRYLLGRTPKRFLDILEYGPVVTLLLQAEEALKLILKTHDLTCKGEDCGIAGIDVGRATVAAIEAFRKEGVK